MDDQQEGVRFEWDPVKELANRRKHRVAFAEVLALFAPDTEALELYDDAHDDDEERFISIGPVRRGIVVVVWTERADEEVIASSTPGAVIRIISARRATKREANLYRAFRGAT